MKARTLAFGFLLLIEAVVSAQQSADPDNLNLSLENLFNQIPMVVTASRREQRADETPASVYVITAEMIKQSGAVTIPELFRTVPGISVITMSWGDGSAHIRGDVGFNGRYSDKILVMINGRPVYWDVYGAVFWEMFPISMEEIKQIEIIKSPASSLYGTNAFSGVVNFITKTPEEEPGAIGKISVGEKNTMIGYVGYAKSLGPLCLKSSAEYDMGDEWDAKTWPEPHRMLRLNGLLEYHFSKTSDLSVSGGYSGTDQKRLFMDEMAGTAIMSGNTSFARTQLNHNELKLTVYGRRDLFNVNIAQQDIETTFETETYDGDLQKVLHFGERGNLTCGGNIRRVDLASNDFFQESHSQNLFAVFADGEYKPLSWLTLASGLRWDYHPLTKGHFSPRASISIKPIPNHIVRLSWGNAFRNPTLLNSYVDFAFHTSFTVEPDHEVPIQANVVGNLNLKPEQINSYEISYLAKPFKRLTSSIEYYYRQYSGAFDFSEKIVAQYAADEAYPGSPAFILPKTYSRQFINGINSTGWGLETQEDFLLTQWLWLTANYTYKVSNSDFTRVTNGGTTLGEAINTPTHQANLGIKFVRNEFSLQTTASFKSRTSFYVSDGRDGLNAELDPNILLNSRLGYTYGKAEVGVSIFNILDRIFYEYPPGNDLAELSLPAPSSDPLSRKIVLSVKVGL